MDGAIRACIISEKYLKFPVRLSIASDIKMYDKKYTARFNG
jgi:hypothetical protein